MRPLLILNGPATLRSSKLILGLFGVSSKFSSFSSASFFFGPSSGDLGCSEPRPAPIDRASNRTACPNCLFTCWTNPLMIHHSTWKCKPLTCYLGVLNQRYEMLVLVASQLQPTRLEHLRHLHPQDLQWALLLLPPASSSSSSSWRFPP